jgi:hypothetical protein
MKLQYVQLPTQLRVHRQTTMNNGAVIGFIELIEFTVENTFADAI